MKLTEEIIESRVVEQLDYKVGNKTTVVVLILVNGFEVVGTSACVDPKDYNHDLGILYARKRAIDKVWELEGYVTQTWLHADAQKEEAVVE